MKFSQVSRQPRKQRKAMYGAALHEKRKRLHAHLSRELRSSLGRRSVLAAKGDGVKVLKGRFKGASGKVTGVSVKNGFLSIEGLVVKKQSGKEVPASFRPNQFVVIEIASNRKIRRGGRKAKADQGAVAPVAAKA